jgi:hypothetical protein
MKNFTFGSVIGCHLNGQVKGDGLGGHVSRMEESINAYIVSFGKPEGKRLLQIRRLE